MNDSLVPLLTILLSVGFVVLIIGGMVVAVVVNKRRARERTAALKSAASFLGWEFTETAPMNWIPNLEKFALFSQGHSKNITNMMYGEINGVKSALFDYEYTVGHGKHRHTYTQSVVYCEPRNLNVPLFSLRPENTLYKIFQAFGYQDIDFGNRPTFSSKYLLRGADEPAIRSIFNDSLLAFYETNQGISTDGGGNQLFVFRQNYKAPPTESQSFVNWGHHVQNLFRRIS
jgi:hypothetical protein